MELRSIIKKIPGTQFLYVKGQQCFYSLADSLGFTPDKNSVVSREYWQKRAKNEWQSDHQEDPTFQASLKEFSDVLKTLKWNSLLEVGCGHGRVLEYLRKEFPKVQLTGGDFSEAQIAHARRRLQNQNVKFDHFDATKIPYPDNSVDYILTSNSLIYLHPKLLLKALSEFYRVCRHGVFIAEYAKEFLDTKFRRKAAVHAPFFVHAYSKELPKAGFKVLRSDCLKAWANQPERLPQAWFLAEKKL